MVPMTYAHVDALYEAARDPEIWRYTRENIVTLDDASRFVDRAMKAERTLPFVVTEQGTGRVLGSTRLYDLSPGNRSLELGVSWLRSDVWRTGVNRECKYLLLRHSFESLGTVRVQLKADVRNVRSQLAIERLGASREGIMRNHIILPDGTVRDSVIYSITDYEWPVVKSALEADLGLRNPAARTWSMAHAGEASPAV
nr:GNAT family N-acetyltransferase [Paenibacillus phyllosphaerae]